MQPAILFFAVFLASTAIDVDAIIPLPCADMDSLVARKCCPVPNLAGNPGPCGVNSDRGSCELIRIPDSQYDSSERDVRKKWPIQYFTSTCVCNEKFGGVGCGECSYGYNDGTPSCVKKTVYKRPSVNSMNEDDWRYYRDKVLRVLKNTPSRYMVATKEFTEDILQLKNSLVRPTTYELFVWLHHLVAKDNNITQGE